jgi:2-polyprenyl-6-methoxyphenol hydroxylase-like FAD-dependent oxidoreductase
MTAAGAPILIAGAGPIGLGLALDLAWRGRHSIVVEQETGHQVRAKAAFLSERTMEFCRRWKMVDQVAHAGFPNDYPVNMVFCTSLSGHLIGQEILPSANERRPPEGSPEILRWCPQMWFDPLLAEAAKATGLVDLRYGCRLEGFRETETGVYAEVVDTSSAQRSVIVSDYLVACDGVGSKVRRDLGISYDGNPALSFSVNVLIRMPNFLESHNKGKAGLYLMVGPGGIWSHFTCVNGKDLWRCTIVGSEEKLDLTRLDVNAEVKRAFGRQDISFEILSAQPWRRSACTASAFRAGRIFLAGDSAHSMSSTGGYGMNTGMGDVIDLSWKLDAVLGEWGGPHLLDSYEAERRPIALRNIAAATTIFNTWTTGRDDWAHLSDDTPEGAEARHHVAEHLIKSLRPEWVSTGVALGYRYEDSPIIVSDGTPAPPDSHSEYVQTARPGHRAPHAYLPDGRSTIDLFGRGFVLLEFNKRPADVSALSAAAAKRRVPLTVHRIEETTIAALYERALVLVRPDGHTAWRGDVAQNADTIIDQVTGAIAPRRSLTGRQSIDADASTRP